MNDALSQTRRVGIDLIKSFAIFGVLVQHTAYYGFLAPVRSFGWISAAVWGSVFRTSVPLFFMCSGALLLAPEKELPLRRLFGKNYLKILLAVLVWALGYKLFHLLLDGAFSLPALWQGVKETLLFQHEFHLYFLHILLLVYAFLPLTRRFVRHATDQELRYALALWFLLGILYPTLRPYWPLTLLSAIPLQWMLNMSYAAIGYGLLGYCLSRRPLSPSAAVGLGAAGLVLTFVPTLLLSLRQGTLAEQFLGGMSVGVCLLAAGQYALLDRLGARLRERSARRAGFLSRSSFCVYLVHVVFLNLFQRWDLTAAVYPAVIAIPALSLLLWLLSAAVYLVLSRIPFVRKWLI